MMVLSILIGDCPNDPSIIGICFEDFPISVADDGKDSLGQSPAILRGLSKPTSAQLK